MIRHIHLPNHIGVRINTPPCHRDDTPRPEIILNFENERWHRATNNLYEFLESIGVRRDMSVWEARDLPPFGMIFRLPRALINPPYVSYDQWAISQIRVDDWYAYEVVLVWNPHTAEAVRIEE